LRIDTIKQICATGAQNLIWIRLHGTYLDGNDGFTAKPKADTAAEHIHPITHLPQTGSAIELRQHRSCCFGRMAAQVSLMQTQRSEPFERRPFVLFYFEQNFRDAPVLQTELRAKCLFGVILGLGRRVVAVCGFTILVPELHLAFAQKHACTPNAFDDVPRLVSQQHDIDIARQRAPAFFTAVAAGTKSLKHIRTRSVRMCFRRIIDGIRAGGKISGIVPHNAARDGIRAGGKISGLVPHNADKNEYD